MQEDIALMNFSPLEEHESLLPLIGYPDLIFSSCKHNAENPTKWDFVLVCDDHKLFSEKDEKKRKFLEELHKKGFITKMITDKKLFYGVHAPSGIFRKYQWLLKDPDNELAQQDEEQSVPNTTRIRIVSFILHNTKIHTGEKLQHLIKQKVFETAFPLHERKNVERFLQENWTRWRDIIYEQPIEEMRKYLGEKVALYFAWLGFYTRFLFPAALPGVIIFLSGLVNFNYDQVSNEICAANTTIMCPLCDQKCPFWELSDTCLYSKVTHLLDNEMTVLFAIFMALWASIFLELWKRQRAAVVSSWNLYWWDEEEEELAMELINDPDHPPRQFQHSYLRSTIVLILALLMIVLLIGIAHAFVVYRVVVTVIFTKSSSQFFQEQATTMAVLTGALLHYITILLMSKVNKLVAIYLCELEKPRTLTDRENNVTVKYFTFQFFTHFSSLIYVAFFLGRINGRPGNYVRVAGKWRLEECHPSGCLIDLFIQLAIIMTLKQTLNNFAEYMLPWMKNKYKKLSAKPCTNCRVYMEESTQDLCKEEWLQNYQLNEINVFSLFDEFMEMMIQYSFTTIFVAAFPLAPLLAFLNNIVEIRFDAIKMMTLQRRMVPRKAKDIGVWLQVLEAIGILSVIGNGLVIAITSDFIPKQVYKYEFSPCRMENRTDIDCFTGYINQSLSVFNVRDFENPEEMVEFIDSKGQEITHCRYRDYRNSDDYSYTVQFWHIFASRLAFLVLFEHIALCIKFVATWYVPDISLTVKNQHLREKHKRLSERLRLMDDSTDV